MSMSTRFRTWPITAVRSLEKELRAMGLSIPPAAIDGTSGGSAAAAAAAPLSDALVSVGTAGRGGTGSFVSSSGLILTNWHVAYDAVRQASLKTDGENDFVEEGFVSRSKEEEIRAPNYEVWCVNQSRSIICSEISASGLVEGMIIHARLVRRVSLYCAVLVRLTRSIFHFLHSISISRAGSRNLASTSLIGLQWSSEARRTRSSAQ